MKLKYLVTAAALFVASVTAGSAATHNLGDVTNGASTMQKLSVQTVDFYDFSIDAPKGFFVSQLDISVTSISGSNLRESIGLYSGNTLLASNDSGVGGGGSTAFLSFGGASALAEGSYTLGIGGWKAFFTDDISDAYSTAFFNNGHYTLNIETTISAVPLPAGGLLLLSGLGAFAVSRRKKRKA